MRCERDVAGSTAQPQHTAGRGLPQTTAQRQELRLRRVDELDRRRGVAPVDAALRPERRGAVELGLHRAPCLRVTPAERGRATRLRPQHEHAQLGMQTSARADSNLPRTRDG